MNQSNSSKQVLLSVIGVAILVVAVVGVSFAFFNYTRTGGANTVRTGQISFFTDYTAIDVDNLFPVARSTALSDSITETTDDVVGITTVTIQGSTTYSKGIDYTVTAEGVSTALSYSADTITDSLTSTTYNYAAGKLPVSVNVTPSGLGSTCSGTDNTNCVDVTSFENSLANTDAFSSTDRTTLAVGHVGTTSGSNAAVNGTLKIKVYIDKALVGISDTYATPSTDHMGTLDTEPSFGTNRRVLSTNQWNSLNSGTSFKIRVVAQETE